MKLFLGLSALAFVVLGGPIYVKRTATWWYRKLGATTDGAENGADFLAFATTVGGVYLAIGLFVWHFLP